MPIDETVESFEALVNGDLDNVPEQAFLNVGGASDVERKAAELAEGASRGRRLRVEIVTPEASLWAGEATAVHRATSDGDFTILPEHTALVGDIVPGVVRVETAEGELSFAVHGGFFQVGPGDDRGRPRRRCSPGVAEKTTDIDVARAQAAKEAARSAARGRRGPRRLDTSSHLVAQAALERAELRLRAASK